MIRFRQSFFDDWPGFGVIGDALCQAGYGVHRVYQKSLVEFCADFEVDCSLETYWSEVSKEFISSGGFASDRRDRGAARFDRSRYRSLLLDACERVSAEEPRDSYFLPSAHPCMDAILSDLESGGALSLKLRRAISIRVDEEMERFGIARGSLPTPGQAKKAFLEAGKSNGFDLLSVSYLDSDRAEKAIGLRSYGDFILYGSLALMQVPRDRMPGVFSIVWHLGRTVPDPYHDLSLGDLSFVMPGVDYYARNLRDAGQMELGLSAILSCAIALAQSLEGGIV
ncbi:hypothetical protein [Sphingomonas sp.]|uniref:hypothetical protein n=1 Tax=Sphingomonas sp. TaxID=28214 RepID=UPI001AFDE0C2|nr:hypothetical protein [Sphingomonas sp.]MBO9713325.1 hypothetical protein [Sphingomonas sp.]